MAQLIHSCSSDDHCPTGYSGENCESIDTAQIQSILNSGVTPLALYDDGIRLDQLYGMVYNNGYIFYLDTVDGSGLVCDTTDLTSGAIWGCSGKDIGDLPNASNLPTNPESEVGAKIGDGSSNTDIIVGSCNTQGIGARLCRVKGSEWFLPSRGELHQMYLNLHIRGLGKFVEETYWSSTEHDATSAWIQHFGIGHRSSYEKYYHHRVRAVRAF
ncbi:MAG: hypothetical protein R2787_02715 [Saprospiraceae bacterium]